VRLSKSLLNKAFFLSCLLLLLLGLPAQGAALFVQDGAGIYSPAYIKELETKLASYSQNQGPEIAVVTTRSLQGKTIEAVAKEIFDKWGIGKRGKDNGLLLLVAIEERSVRIETGYGLEASVPDGVAGEIIRHKIAPLFAKKEFEKGTTQGIEAILEKISTSSERVSQNQDIRWVAGAFALILLFLVRRLNKNQPKNGRRWTPRFPSNRSGGFGGGKGGGGGASGRF
jgi:uncharacterized protein